MIFKKHFLVTPSIHVVTSNYGNFFDFSLVCFSIVYDPQAGNNETQSILVFEKFALDAHLVWHAM